MTDTIWEPPLEDPHQAAGLLFPGIRALLPDVVKLIRQGHVDVTPPVEHDLRLKGRSDLGRFEIRGSTARGVRVGDRDALGFDYRGSVRVSGSTVAFAGTCVIDVATDALLDLRLETPVRA